MAVNCVTLINLFLVPLISLAIAYGRAEKKMQCTTAFWVEYGCYVAVLVPIIKIAATLMEKVMHQPIELYSGYYTLAGVGCAALLPYVASVLKKMFNVKCTIEGKNTHEENK